MWLAERDCAFMLVYCPLWQLSQREADTAVWFIAAGIQLL
jgi:hypothetical protein